jgi:hypothetical protein
VKCVVGTLNRALGVSALASNAPAVTTAATSPRAAAATVSPRAAQSRVNERGDDVRTTPPSQCVRALMRDRAVVGVWYEWCLCADCCRAHTSRWLHCKCVDVRDMCERVDGSCVDETIDAHDVDGYSVMPSNKSRQHVEDNDDDNDDETDDVFGGVSS